MKNNMMIRIFDILVLPIAVGLVVCLLSQILGFEYREKKLGFIVASVLLFIANVSGNAFINDIVTASEISETIVAVSSIALPYFLFKIRKKFTFFWIGCIVCSTVDYLGSLITSFATTETVTISKTACFIIYVVLFATVFAFGRLKKFTVPTDFTDSISPAIYLVIFFAEFSSYYKVILTKDSSFFVGVSNVLTLLSAALVVACFSYIIFRYSSLSYKQKEFELQLQAELKHYEEMVSKNRDIRMFKHDYQNNLFALNTFIKANRNVEALKYIEELSGELKNVQNSFSTGNYLADAIFSEKKEVATASNTSIKFVGTIPSHGINSSDLCAIISNALDNAIRACENQPGSIISVIGEEKPNRFIITFSNPVERKISIKNNEIKTTKKDTINHGLGLSNVKKIAKKYNGSVQLDCTEKEFSLKVGLITKENLQ